MHWLTADRCASEAEIISSVTEAMPCVVAIPAGNRNSAGYMPDRKEKES